MNRNLYAVIPSGQRPRELAGLLHDLIHFSDVKVIVVDTGYEKAVLKHDRIVNIQDRGLINIQRWWNVGLRHIYELQQFLQPGEEFTVAVLNDDLRVPPRFVERLDEGLNVTFPQAAAACPGISAWNGGHLVNYIHGAPRM